MTMTKIISVVSIAILAAGCGAKWVRLDNSAAESAQIEAAKARCQVEEKLYQLRYQEIATDAAISSLSDEASKEDLRKGLEMGKEKVYQAINACMEAEGLKSRS